MQILLAIRSQGGEQALMQTLNRARELYRQRSQPSPSVDDLASLLAQCAIAEAQSSGNNPQQVPGSDPVMMLDSDEVCILAESGRKQIILDAFADGSSFICLKCGGLFSTSRKDEHLAYWLLVFGLGAETPLWRALNHGGRTVFLDENPFYVAHLEGAHPGLEAYDVSYATAVREFPDLLDAARASRSADCRPVQNLLFSDCRLAINDLPNQLYDVSWDVILVDGPSGFTEGSPGRMAAIFSAAVMARTKGAETEVLVHDYQREVESASAREFLCPENRVETTTTPSLGHYVVRGAAAASQNTFCGGDSSPTTKKAN
uniref:Uncharacterized protein n=1 Tax=Oryza brachyantha TaxID=4533 RepID=J3L9R1_ORYBR